MMATATILRVIPMLRTHSSHDHMIFSDLKLLTIVEIRFTNSMVDEPFLLRCFLYAPRLLAGQEYAELTGGVQRNYCGASSVKAAKREIAPIYLYVDIYIYIYTCIYVKSMVQLKTDIFSGGLRRFAKVPPLSLLRYRVGSRTSTNLRGNLVHLD